MTLTIRIRRAWSSCRVGVDGLRAVQRPLLLELDPLDQRDRAAARRHPGDLRARAREELVRHHEDEHRRVLHRGRHVRVGDHVLGELDARQVLDVLVLRVDDVGEVLAVDLLALDEASRVAINTQETTSHETRSSD